MPVDLTVRYFAGARAAAGTEQESVTLPDGATVATLSEHLVREHGPGLARVLAAASFLVDEVTRPPEHPLDGASAVDVLPPFSGG